MQPVSVVADVVLRGGLLCALAIGVVALVRYSPVLAQHWPESALALVMVMALYGYYGLAGWLELKHAPSDWRRADTGVAAGKTKWGWPIAKLIGCCAGAILWNLAALQLAFGEKRFEGWTPW
jgi:hypothetical protein